MYFYICTCPASRASVTITLCQANNCAKYKLYYSLAKPTHHTTCAQTIIIIITADPVLIFYYCTIAIAVTR